jgi:hypothetical protein
MERGTEGEIDHTTDTADATAHVHETEGTETGRGTTNARTLPSPFANASNAHARPPRPDHRRPNADVAAAQDHDQGRRTSAIRSLCPTKRSPSAASITPTRHPQSMVVRLSTRRSPTSRRLVHLRSMPTVSRAPRSRSNTMSLQRRANLLRRSRGAYSCLKATM